MVFQKQLSLTYLQSGGLITNYYCSSRCRHCLYRCSPKWPKDYISSETARKNLEAVRKSGCYSVHIGGGEPLLQPDDLTDVLAAAQETGVSVEYVETNSSWFRNLDEAGAILQKLAENGLTTLLVSISPFHNEQIPFYKVKGVLEACRQTGVSVFPWVSGFLADLSAFDENQTHTLEEYQQRFGADYIKNLPQRYWISPGGRALETFGQFAPRKPAAQIVAQSYGCAELAETSHFHIDLYGNYVPGLCAGLSIRREDLGKPLQSEEYPIISCLYSKGIGAFATYAMEQYGFEPSEAGYASKCALCYDIRRFLVVEQNLDSNELQPRGHYLYG
jgi:hypothetical protein